MNREEIFSELTNVLYETLCLKNQKYDNSYSKIRDKFKFPVILIRLNDKLNRLENLMLSNDEGTVDESVDDTLLDLAGYCILELTERRIDDAKLSQAGKRDSKALL